MVRVTICPPDCPNRSMECRLTCEKYKAYRAAKEIEYKKRATVYAGQPTGPQKMSNLRRKAKQQFRGR